MLCSHASLIGSRLLHCDVINAVASRWRAPTSNGMNFATVGVPSDRPSAATAQQHPWTLAPLRGPRPEGWTLRYNLFV